MVWLRSLVSVVTVSTVALTTAVVVGPVSRSGWTPPEASVVSAPPAAISPVAAPRKSPRLVAPRATPARPQAGSTVRLSGTVPGRWRARTRAVQVQQKKGAAWRTVVRVRVHAKAKGAWTVSRKAPSGRSHWRVVLQGPTPRVVSRVRVLTARAASRPAIPKPSGQATPTLPAKPTPSVTPSATASPTSTPTPTATPTSTPTSTPTVTPTPETTELSFDQPQAEIFGRPVTFTGTVSGGARPVLLEEERLLATGERVWQPLGSGTAADGTWSITATPQRTGAQRWRATVAATGTATAATSAPRTGQLRSLRGTMTVSPVDTDHRIWVTVRSDDPVASVTVYMDGRESRGTFHDEDAGLWWTIFDTDPLASGTHRVTAQLRNGAARGLVTSDPFETTAPAQAPDWLERTTVAAGFTWPTTFAMAGADSQLVAEKGGLVWWVRSGVRDAAPVIDLSAVVGTTQDRGLVGLALHPDFDPATLTGWVYLAYTVKPEIPAQWSSPSAATQVVTRMWLTDGARDGAEQVVLGSLDLAACPVEVPETPDCLPSFSSGHTIDDLLFAPDGSLFVSVGDGVIYAGDMRENWRSQRLDVLAGKVLRIDPETGLGRSDNPFHTGSTDPGDRNRNRVWAYGFRNPFRMTLSPDGDLVVGDVGHITWEEVAVVRAGENHGWPCYEGTARVFTDDPRPGCLALWDEVQAGTDDLTWPLHVYRHNRGLGSVTVGNVLDSSWPVPLAGRVLYADYNHQTIGTLDLAATGAPGTIDQGDPQPLLSGSEAGTPVKFVAAPDGSQWYLSIAEGELRRLRPGGGADQVTCPPGRFRSEWWAGASALGTPDAVTCEDRADTDRAPGHLRGGELTVRWQADPRTLSGPLRLHGTEGLAVSVNGTSFTLPASGGAPPVVGVAAGITRLEASTTVAAGGTASWSFDQPGQAPTVHVDLAGGAWVDPGDDVPWTVRATDQNHEDVSESATLLVELLHHGEGDFHSHQEQVVTASSGTLNLSPAHAPGQTVFRVSATANDAEGRTGVSTPLFVCLTGNRVGVCS